MLRMLPQKSPYNFVILPSTSQTRAPAYQFVFPNARYLINAPPGLQRMGMEIQGMSRWHKIKGIWITGGKKIECSNDADRERAREQEETDQNNKQSKKSSISDIPDNTVSSHNENKQKNEVGRFRSNKGGLSWESIGGLPGIWLTRSSVGLEIPIGEINHNENKRKKNGKESNTPESFNVYGPPNTTRFMNTIRHFIKTDIGNVNVRDYQYRSKLEIEETGEVIHPQSFRDDNIEIIPYVIRPQKRQNTSEASMADPVPRDSELEVLESLDMVEFEQKFLHYVYSERKSGIKRPHQDSSTKLQRILQHHTSNIQRQLPSVQQTDDIVCYLARTGAYAGRFNANKAAELGVPVGIRKALVQGQDVTTAEGKLYRSADVVEAATPAKSIFVVTCPSVGYIPALLALKIPEEFNVVLMTHDTPEYIIRHPEYRKFMERYPVAKHVSVDGHDLRDALTGSELTQYQLSRIDSSLYPYKKPPTPTLADIGIVTRAYYGMTWEFGRSVKLLPKKAKEVTNPDVEFETELAKLLSSKSSSPRPEFKKNLSTHGTIDSNPANSLKEEDNVEIITLGTGGMIPAKYRNVSSTLVKLNDRYVMLDCGEGTVTQLERYSRNMDIKLEDLISKIDIIFISHMHADHHLGFIEFCRLWNSINNQRTLLAITPTCFHTFLAEYDQVDNYLHNVKLVQAHSLKSRPTGTPPEVELTSFFKGLDISTIQTHPAAHCYDSHSIIIRRPVGGCIVFTGDSRPVPSLARVAYGARVLIHEATFEEALQHEAVARGHSTMTEAIRIGQLMKAQCLVMTHFSQRYPKVTNEHQFSELSSMDIVLAFDLMHLKVSEAWKARQYIPVIAVLFRKDPEGENFRPIEIEGVAS